MDRQWWRLFILLNIVFVGCKRPPKVIVSRKSRACVSRFSRIANGVDNRRPIDIYDRGRDGTWERDKWSEATVGGPPFRFTTILRILSWESHKRWSSRGWSRGIGRASYVARKPEKNLPPRSDRSNESFKFEGLAFTCRIILESQSPTITQIIPYNHPRYSSSKLDITRSLPIQCRYTLFLLEAPYNSSIQSLLF